MTSVRTQQFDELLNQGVSLDKILQANTSLDPADLNYLYLAAVKKHWKNLPFVPITADNYFEICIAAVQQNGEALEFIPKPNAKEEIAAYDKICNVAIAKSASALLYVPEDLRSESLCDLAINKDARMLLAVPLPLRTPVRCLLAVQKYGLALHHVPTSIRTDDMCLAAVKQMGEALSYVPEKNMRANPLICLEAVKQDGRVLGKVPVDLRNHAISLAAVIQNGLALPHVPVDLLTIHSDIPLAAVNQNPEAISLLPLALRNYDVSLTAVKNNPLMLEHVPENLKRSDPDINQIAVAQNWRALSYVPLDLRDENLCVDAYKQNPLALEFIPESIKLAHPEMCASAVEKNPDALAFVPPALRTYEMCIKAVKTKWEMLKEVPLELREKHFDICEAALAASVNAMQYLPNLKESYEYCLKKVTENGFFVQWVPTTLHGYEEICLAALNQNGMALYCIPQHLRNAKLCLVAVQNGGNLEEVPMPLRTFELCLAALEVSSISFHAVPPELKQDYKICYTAIERNGMLLGQIANHLRDEKLYLAAVKENGLALEFVPKDLPQYRELCLAAVKENGLALKFVPEELRPAIIDAVSVEKILAGNYGARHFLPSNYEPAIKAFLAKIQNVVITDDDVLKTDHEMKDIYLVYSNAPKRAGKTLHVDREHSGLLLQELQGKQPINLVLLGHANPEAETIAGIYMSEVATCLEQVSNIEAVTLLGCNTAKSQKLAEEQTDIRYFSQLQAANRLNCGLVLATKSIDPSDYQALLAKHNLHAAFLVTKTTDAIGNPIYQLIHIRINSFTERIMEEKLTLNTDGLKKLQNIFRKGKELPFPKEANQVTYMRGGTQDFLNKSEFEKTTEVIEGAGRLDKNHPQYKKYKNDYPFLRGVTIDETEIHKLEESLLKKLVSEVKKRSGIKQRLSAKGYTKALHVDTKEGRMHVTHTHLYPSSYKHSTFYKRHDNINRKKLSDERKATIDEMTKGNMQGETTVKSIKIVFKR